MPRKRRLGVDDAKTYHRTTAKRRIVHTGPCSAPFRGPNDEERPDLCPVCPLPNGRVLVYYTESESSPDTDWESRSDTEESEIDSLEDMDSLDEIRCIVNPNSFAKIRTDSASNYSVEERSDDSFPANRQDFSHSHPNAILAHMCKKVQERHEERYKEYFSQCSHDKIQNTLRDLLRSEAKAVLDSGVYFRENLLQIGGKPDHQRGIYLHVLWRKDDPEQFWLYIGQSVELEQRLERHRNIRYRTRHSSLHYFIWDQQNEDNESIIEEKFVYLAIIDKEIDALSLNLLEMRCALTLQTLTLNALREYLPDGAVAPYAGKHLNVALPIYQSHQPNAVQDPFHGDIYHSEDPLIQRYCASLRRRFLDLKFSPNNLVREYYYKCWKTNAAVRRYSSQLKAAKKAQTGINLKAYGTINKRSRMKYYEFFINYFRFTLNRRLIEDITEEEFISIQVRYDLTKDESLHPFMYARRASTDDRCCRLDVHVEGNDPYGRPFLGWVSSDGELQVKKMNTFVDWLEAYENPLNYSGRKRFVL